MKNYFFILQDFNYTCEKYIINYLEKIKREKKDEEFFKKIIEEKEGK